MTGPNYPPNPEVGSNALGRQLSAWGPENYKHRLYNIGFSQIGDIPLLDPRDTIISQYANSPIICGLIDAMFAWLDPTKLTNDFYDNVWNIESASGYGLDVWGQIVGVSRVILLYSEKFVGFSEAATGANYDHETMSHGVFFRDNTSGGTNYKIADSAYRRLILTKALVNISDGSIPSINQMLLTLFPDRGNCYVRTDAAMEMTYVFEFSLTDVESAIVSQSGVLPKPCGVTTSVEIVTS